MASLIDGKQISQQVIDEVALGVTAFRQHYARTPGLAVVLVGKTPPARCMSVTR